MKTRKSIKSTVAIGKGMLVAALALNGFEINAEKTYLEAYRDDVNLVIFLVARCLSNTENKKKESTDISAPRASVKKFLRYCGFELETLLNGDISIEDLRTDITGVEAIPCIAYCVEKYDYDDAEIVIVPVSEVIEKSQRGGIFTVSEDRGDFKYDFNKVTGKAVPNGALTRSFFYVENFSSIPENS